MEPSGRTCRIENNINSAEFLLEKGDLKEGIYFLELKGEKLYRGKFVVE